MALPIFYQQNSFVARYCSATNVSHALLWLRNIGAKNRHMLGQVYLRDDNPGYDRWQGNYVDDMKKRLKRRFNAEVESLDHSGHCCHHVIFLQMAEAEAEPEGLEWLFGVALWTCAM